MVAQYNQQARRDTLFVVMNAMASAAYQQNELVCRSKTQATVDAITGQATVDAIPDFLANVGSE